MKQNTPVSYYDYQISPDYNKQFKYMSNFNSPQNQRKDSEVILSQTRASLNKFLSNLQKGSTMNSIMLEKNKNKQSMPTISNISYVSNNKFMDDAQGKIDAYNKIRQIYIKNNADNKYTNILTYNKMNNTLNQGIKNLSQNNNNINNNKNIIRVNKIINNNNTQVNEGNYKDNNIIENKNLSNNIYNTINTDNNINNNINNNNYISNTVRRTRKSIGLYTNDILSAERKEKKINNNINDINNIKVVKNISNKLKKLKIDNIKNKNDIFSLRQIYDEMQKILLQEISRYAKLPKDVNLKQLNEVKNELNEYKNKYIALLESSKKTSDEKDLKINDLLNQLNKEKEINKNLESKIKELNEENEKRISIINSNEEYKTPESNKKLLIDLENFKKEIKRINKENQELQNNILIKDITIEKYNEKIKDFEEKLKSINDKQLIYLELKEKEKQLKENSIDGNNKFNIFETLVLDYKKKNEELIHKNEELIKENKNIKGLYNILKSQKKYLYNENSNNRQLIEDLKINNEQLIKERDDYKIKKEKLINEIEIIKINTERITNIKALNNSNANKLKTEINLLKKEKEFLGQKNDELKKRIDSIDKKSLRNKSVTEGNNNTNNTDNNNIKLVDNNYDYKKFENLSIFNNKDFSLILNDINHNKSLSFNKDQNINIKIPNKFTKLSISNKTVNIKITKKNGATSLSKKGKKNPIKFKRLIYSRRVVDIYIKSNPKSAQKAKKKKFTKLKEEGSVSSLTIKSKHKDKKFKPKKLKPTSINNFIIESSNIKKEIPELKKNKNEIAIQKSNKDKINENNNNKLDDKNTNKNNDKINDIKVYEIKKGETIFFEGKAKPIESSIVINNNKNEQISLNNDSKVKDEKNNIDEIKKNETSNLNNKVNNTYSISNKISIELKFNIKPKKEQYQIIKNDLINYEGKKKLEEKKGETNIVSNNILENSAKTENDLHLIDKNDLINKEGKKKIFSDINIIKIESFSYNKINNNIKELNSKKEIKEEKEVKEVINKNVNNKKYEIEKHNSFKLEFNLKPKKDEYKISKNNLVNYVGKKRPFSKISKNKNESFYIKNNIKNNSKTLFDKKKLIFKPLRICSFMMGKPKKKNLFNIKSFGTGLFDSLFSDNNDNNNNNSNNISYSSKNLSKYDSHEIKKKIVFKISRSQSFGFNGIKNNKKDKKYNLLKDNNNHFFFEPHKKKLILNISPNEKINFIPTSFNNELKNMEKEKEKNPISSVSSMESGDEKLKTMIEDLNNLIKSKDEELEKIKKEKSESDSFNQLFNEESTKQIENLTNNVNQFKEENEKLKKENETLKSDLEQKKQDLETKIKELESDKTNLNKTIEELTKEASNLKLDLLKKKTEIQNLKNSANNTSNSNTIEKPPENNNEPAAIEKEKDNKSQENQNEIEALKEELSKLRNSKIIETSQLKLEATKYKVEIKRLTAQIEKLKIEKEEAIKKNEENMDTFKINDFISDNKGDNINDLKNKNKEYQEQIILLKKEIEEYKSKPSGSGGVDIKKFEELKKQNAYYYNKIQEAQKKILQANSLINKAKNYNLCIVYLSKLMVDIKPSNDNQKELLNKLKSFVDEFEKERNLKKP